jgi:hypothetical protein
VTVRLSCQRLSDDPGNSGLTRRGAWREVPCPDCGAFMAVFLDDMFRELERHGAVEVACVQCAWETARKGAE